MTARRAALLALALGVPGLAGAWPWSQDMMNQPSIKPQEGVMRPFPKRSIPVGGIPTMVRSREEAKGLKNPIPPTPESIAKGRVLFRIYCSACHGLTGGADSPVTGKIGAIPLVSDYVQQQLTEGWIWGTITFGSYVMPAYGAPELRPDRRGSNDLSPEERWHVVNYVKHQLVKDHEREAKTRTASAGGAGH
ncbi:MAG: cytochrome c [Gammaproteobacteria bacterium]|nr:MAG: cytochrome c [Gammaproteobacteria bacterium]